MITYSTKQCGPNPFNFTMITSVILESHELELGDFAGRKKGQDFSLTKTQIPLLHDFQQTKILQYFPILNMIGSTIDL